MAGVIGTISNVIRTFFWRVFHHEKLQEAIFAFLLVSAMLIGQSVCGKHWVLGFFLGTAVFGFFALGFQWLIGDIEFGGVGESFVGVLGTVAAFVIGVVACIPALFILALIAMSFEGREYLFGLLGIIGLLLYFGLCWVVVLIGTIAVEFGQFFVGEARTYWKARKLLKKVRPVGKVPSTNP